MDTRRLGGLPSYLVLLVLLLVWLYQTFRPAPPPPALPGQVQVFFMPQEGERAKAFLLERIQNTRERLEVAAYEFRDLSLAKALLEAKDRGVRVRLYGESDYREDVRRYLVAARLGQTREPPRVGREEVRARVRQVREGCEEVAGLEVCYDEREPFMHHKFLVFDGQAVWTGSTNLTWNAFARNNENSLYLPSPPLAEGYEREFEALWSGKKEGLGLPVRFALEGVEGTVYFSPAGGRAAREALLARLRAAREEVLVAAFVLTDQEVLKALVQAQARGVRVRAVLETRNMGTSGEELLLKAGIDVRKDANPYTLHHKVAVIDGTWVVTGSYNFSTSAWRRNNENLLVLKAPGLAQKYRKEVEALWEAGTPL
ncbi:phospholipase D-like domain-containing protein [Thermus filiformis]|uniref:phospholipase D n=1 Tax=Thermus filiformis TaxID=276 RepID=A0A0A2WPD2_THEFI|nr:phospholipase D-like domain-containing protein [Thermus filiformis]KGQ21648.1 phospholipase D [Thermus filiformis]